MENKPVFLKNLINSKVVIDVPDLRLQRVWERQGARRPIDLELLKEAFYDPAVEYLLRNGILEIEDKEARVELGLETADEEPTYLIPTEAEMKRYLTIMPIYEFKEKIKTMSREQLLAITDYAIQHDLMDYEKDELLKKAVEIDIVRAIQLKKAAEEK